jgi:VanZ family protein
LFRAVPAVRPFLRYWLPVILWMTMIFIGSTNTLSSAHTSRFLEPFLRWIWPGMSEEVFHNIHFVIRKCGHLTEYAVLALLLWRALRKPVRGDTRPWDRRLVLRVILLAMLYAASDEFHQSFYSARDATIRDVIIDTIGASLAMGGLWTVGRWLKNW